MSQTPITRHKRGAGTSVAAQALLAFLFAFLVAFSSVAGGVPAYAADGSQTSAQESATNNKKEEAEDKEEDDEGGLLSTLISLVVAPVVKAGATVANGAKGVTGGSVLLSAESTGGTVTIPVNVNWSDNSDEYGLRPSSITVNTEAYDSSWSSATTGAVVLNDNGTDTWTGSLTIPSGSPYCSVEVGSTYGYKFSASPSSIDSSDPNNIPTSIEISATRYAKIPDPNSTGTVSIQLVWDDNNDQGQNRPASLTGTISPQWDSNAVDAYYDFTISPDANDQWIASVSVPTAYYGGEQIQYLAKMSQSDIGYAYDVEPSAFTSWTGSPVASDGTANVFTLSSDSESYDVDIVWEDTSSDTRPTSVGVTLYNDSTSVQTVQLDVANATVDGDTWHFDDVFVNLPAYVAGQSQDYRISVDGVPSYSTRAFNKGDGFMSVNVWSDSLSQNTTGDVVASIIWNDMSDAESERPAYVTVSLISATDTPVVVAGPTQVSGSGNTWTHTFQGLPLYKRVEYGNRVEYQSLANSYILAVRFPNDYASDATRFYRAWTAANSLDAQNATITASRTFGINRYVKNVNIVWDDNGDAAGERPTDINLRIRRRKDSNRDDPVITYIDKIASSSDAVADGNTWSIAAATYADDYEFQETNAYPPYEPYTSGIYGAVPATEYADGYGRHEIWEYSYSLVIPDVDGYDKSDPVEGPDGTITVIYSKRQQTGSLTVSKTVSGDGADQNQAFQFTVTLGDNTINGTYGDMTFTNGVATFSLAHGQSVSASSLPAGTTFDVSEGSVANYTPSWVNQSGTIGANTTVFSSCENAYVAPTGDLTVSKTVAGDGADQSQAFQFTVALGNGTISGTYGDMTFTGGVATFSLTHGQSATATGLPAGISYSVSETLVENYTPTSNGESGTITANTTATAAFLNTYTAPVVIPETSAIVVNRVDDTDGIEVASMLLAESVPVATPVSSLDPSDFQMTITPGGTVVSPTADTETNALVYNFDLANGQTANVDLIVGSNVQVVNRTSSVSLAKKAGDGTEEGQTFTVGAAPSNSSLSLTVGASQSSTPSTPSQSGERDKGWIQVNKVINDGATYDAFKVFDADVVNDEGTYKGTHLTWADEATKQAVRSFLTSYDEDGVTGSDYDSWLAEKYGTTVTYDMRDNPQNAAEFIAIKIADSDEDTTAATTPKTTKGDTFATKLATVLRNYGIEPTVVIPANTQTPTDQGYYIVATTTATIENGEAGTAPIWAPVPQTGYVVDEKVSVPTFNKQVKDNTDDTTNFNKVADASTGQWLDFKLTTTLPQNLRAYPTYSLSISDQIPDGMDATIDTENGFSVSLAGTDVTSKVDASLSGSTLSVSVANVLDETTLGVAVDGNDTLVVNYRARLNANSVKGAAGNNNTATLTYSADPLVASTTGTLESSARVLTYQLKVDKVDEATRLNVDGAKFVAKTNVGGTDYWVKEDGSLTTTEEERGVWTTENGFLTISGIDEGTYVLTEIEAPSLYETITAPLSVTIDAVKDYAGGSLTSLGAQASGANGTLVSNPSANQDGVVGTVLETGTSEVRISDVKQIVLPITGLPVKTAGIIAGVVIAVASVIAVIADRRRKDDEEEGEE